MAAPDSTAANDVAANVRFEPSAPADGVSSVVHVHVTMSSSAALALFEGTLSSYYLSKFKHGEVPSTIASRQVPVVSWRSGLERVVAPVRPLALGPHSLVSSDGLVTEFNVATAGPMLERWWPPAAGGGSPQFALYCRPDSDSPALPSAATLILEPEQLPTQLSPGVDEAGLFAERCSHLVSQPALGSEQIWVPPPRVGDWALSPAIFDSAEPAAAAAIGCRADELAFGPGCASVADDRVSVRTPAGALLWLVHTARGALLEVSGGGTLLTIDGLLPDAQEHIWGTTRDLSGAAQRFELELHTAAARERPILNEALADALGPEPQSEWVEVLNDGTLAVDLAAYSLQDGGGRTPLPHASLAPHEFALLVRDDFAPNSSDPPPAPGTRLIRLPALGKSGLSNAGERLALVDGAGVERSVLPALSGKAGQSLARRNPAAEDRDPKAFSFGTPTPGFANDQASSAP